MLCRDYTLFWTSFFKWTFVFSEKILGTLFFQISNHKAQCDEKFLFNVCQILKHLPLHDNLNIDQLSPLIILRNDWIVEKVQQKPNHEIQAGNNLKAILLKV